jgi:predicted nuclease with RNAse H fold
MITPQKEYYIGWDVGGWNCDKNSKSRDAIVILNNDREQVGNPWRGNLSKVLASSNSTEELLTSLFSLCKTSGPIGTFRAVMAIDTPLGFSTEFVDLLTKQIVSANVFDHVANPYLFRKTERLLFKKGHKPLSPIKDMIGSQATKGIHARNKFTPFYESCGAWTDQKALKVIEAYPASCCKSTEIVNWLKNLSVERYHQDIQDAAICSMVAYYFDRFPEKMFAPVEDVPSSEGWIWTLN